MKSLQGLYAITDESLMPEPRFVEMARCGLAAGISILQYRDKSGDRHKQLRQANQLKALCDEYNAILIINDDIELAAEVAADGVHIGKDDQSLQQARHSLGENSIIGVSCYDRLELALDAAQQGADYIAFGSFFASSIKPDAPRASLELITQFKQQSNTPLCCIGGITRENHLPLVNAGADMLAVISDVFQQNSDDAIQSAVKAFTHSFTSSPS